MIRSAYLALALIAAPIATDAQQTAPAAAVPPDVGFSDLADLVLAAPLIADATIRSAAKIKPAEAPGLYPGKTRFYVEADVNALIRGPADMPVRVGYLVDLSPDASGKLPKLKKMRVLLFARALPNSAPNGAPNNAGQIQLVATDGQMIAAPSLHARVREIVRAAIAADAPPQITGVGNAFYVPGALPGEGETQVFLTTRTGAPVSLSVLRRPGEQPRWAVSLSEIVDEAAAPPPRDTLLWYRLACGLPAVLPPQSTASLEPDAAQSASTDYRFVLAQLGPCGRTRAHQPTSSN